jgi:L-rhamnose 1-dehydrogenase
MKLLEGKVAAITGAATGIGRAIALDYLRHGARVAINYYPDDGSRERFRELQQEAGDDAALIGIPGDITQPETGHDLVRQTVQAFGRLDIFVSNAGVCEFADFLTYVPSHLPLHLLPPPSL